MNPLIRIATSTFFFLSFTSFIWASNLDIHHIGVGQGDATLFVFTYDDGSTVNILVDTGNSNSKGNEVFDYLVAAIPVAANRNIHVLITSHLHSDHYGGTPRLLDLLGSNNWGVFRIIDRSGGVSPGPEVACYTVDGVVVENDPTPPEYAEPASNMYNRYITACDTYFPDRRVNVRVGTELFRDVLGITDGTFQFWNLANNAYVLNTYGTLDATAYQAQNENDLSNVWLVQYEGFKYFTGGDVGGGGGGYLDLETPLCYAFLTWPDYPNFHFCSFKVSHHGSPHSTNLDFVSTACGDPTLAIVPSALRSFSGTQIPGAATLGRLTDHGTDLLYTYIKDNGVYYEGTVYQYNHVILSVTNPGFGQNIPMAIQQAKVDKRSLEIVELWGNGTVTCSKNHAAPAFAQRQLNNLDGHISADSHAHAPGPSSDHQHATLGATSKLDRRVERLNRKALKKQERIRRCQIKKRMRIKKKAKRIYDKIISALPKGLSANPE